MCAAPMVQWMLHMCKLHLCAEHVQASAIPHICATCMLLVYSTCAACVLNMCCLHTCMLQVCCTSVSCMYTVLRTTCRLHACKLLVLLICAACIHTFTTVLHTRCITYNDIHLSINPMYLNVAVLLISECQLHCFILEDLFQELILCFHVCCIHKN